jgi:hypothetical protein
VRAPASQRSRLSGAREQLRKRIFVARMKVAWNGTVRAHVDGVEDRHCSDRPMNLRSTFRISSLGAASAALSFAIALAVSAASPAPQLDTSRDSGISDTVNRTSKGDRMRVIVRPPQSTPFEVQMPGGASQRTQDGCESGFGWQMDQTSAAKVERCVT